MSSTAQAFAQSLKLPPAEAVDAIAQRGDQMTVSWSWMDVLNDQHSQQFTISRLTRADLLQAIHTSLAKSVNGDLNRTDWMRDTRSLLQKAGWWGKKQSINSDTGEIVQTKFDNARLKLIFDTNTRQAYSAGRWQRTVRNKASHPYIRYVTMRDEKVRQSHRQWEGITLPVDHSFWRTHLPPNGFRCRCRWVAVTQAEYDKGYSEWRAPYSYDKDGKLKSIPPVERLEFKKTAPEITTRQYHNRSTGNTETIPVGIDPGFNYNAGQALIKQRRNLIKEKLSKLDPAIAAAAQAGRLENGVGTFTGKRPDLLNLPDVKITELTGDEFGASASKKELQRAAHAHLLQLQKTKGSLRNDDSGWLLSLNRKGVSKMGKNPDQTPQSSQAVANIEELVRQAIVAEWHPDTKHQNPDVTGVYRLYAPVLIGGKLYRVKLTVKDYAAKLGKRTLHALEAAEIENAPLGTLLTYSSDTTLQTAQPTTGRMVSIAQLLDGAKLEDGTLIIDGNLKK